MNDRFYVEKEIERAEVVVVDGPTGFDFVKGETYVFTYSFRAKQDMRVASYSTRFGQLKGASNGFLLSGDPMFSLRATNDGINVYFSNQVRVCFPRKPFNRKSITAAGVEVLPGTIQLS